MTERRWLYLGLASVLSAPLLWATATFLWTPASDLAGVHSTIKANIPEIAHISAQQLAASDPDTTIIFDTREAEEYAVSHLPGSIRIPPEMSVADFMRNFEHLISGKTVVFYCSVGVRSTQYASKIQNAIRTNGGIKTVNLELGLFGWHNDGRPLVNQRGEATMLIHPYDDNWGQLLERKSFASKFPK